MTKRFLAICLFSLILVALFVPSCTPTTGTIEVKATLDGVPWTGAVSYKLSPASGSDINGTAVTANFTVAAGNWTCAYVSGGPGIFVNITPSATQEVVAGGTKTFTLNFRTPVPLNAWVTFKSWTINGTVVDPAAGPFPVVPGTIIDCEYTEHVEGEEEGTVVTVHQTSWLKIHNNGIEGEPGPSIWLHAKNHPGAVTMNPPAEKKENQTCTVEGVPVPECTEIELVFCDWVWLDVEVDWDLKICTEYEKTINWLGFPSPEEILFDISQMGVMPGQMLELISYACVEVEGDTDPDDDCCAESPKLQILLMPGS